MRALTLALCLVATPALAAEQFDLLCRGDDEPWHYRIDLAKSEWCADKCKTVHKIASITSGTIVLQSKEPQFKGGDRVINSINRATGEWYFHRSLPGVGFNKAVTGTCELRDFSGFPSAKAKF